MGAADIVPGISGGTIAFIMGFYEDLLHAIQNFLKPTSFLFLLALLSGAAFSFISLAHVIDFVLNHETYRVYLYGGFFGLVVASALFCMKQVNQWRSWEIVSFIVGLISAYFLTGMTMEQEGYRVPLDIPYSLERTISNYDHSSKSLLNVSSETLIAMVSKGIITVDTPVYEENRQKSLTEIIKDKRFSYINMWQVLCGAIAVCALLLPGISGSYLLTILGEYSVVIGAIADFTQGLKQGIFESASFSILISLGIGIIVGALVFSRIVSWALKKYHGMTIALMIGFMIGALRSVWPFWQFTYVVQPLRPEKGLHIELLTPFFPEMSDPQLWLGVLFALAGFGLVLLVERLSTKNRV